MPGAKGVWSMNRCTVVAAVFVAASTLIASVSVTSATRAQDGKPASAIRDAVKPKSPRQVISPRPAPGGPGAKRTLQRRTLVPSRPKRSVVAPHPPGKVIRVPAPVIPPPGVRQWVTKRAAWVWSTPSRQSQKLWQVRKGARIQVVGAQRGFYHVANRKGKRGWIPQDAVRLL